MAEVVEKTSSEPAVSVEAPLLPPRECTTADALAKKHLADKALLDAKISAMKRPRLGKPISSAQIELQAAGLREEYARTVAAEKAQLEAYLAYLAAKDAPPAKPAGSAEDGASDAEDGDAADSAAAAGGAGEGEKSKRKRKKKGAAAAAAAAPGSAASSASSAPAVSASLSKESEMRLMLGKLRDAGLGMHAIPGDGHCLFRATADQLERLASAAGRGVRSSAFDGGEDAGMAPYIALRRRAATYIRLHADEFAPFLPYEPADGYPDEGDDGTPAAAAKVKAAVEKYCARLASSSCWGGHPEIRALAGTLGLPIMVYQAEGAPWKMGVDDDAMLSGSGARTAAERELPVLRLAFLRYAYALGEHYNSVVPL